MPEAHSALSPSVPAPLAISCPSFPASKNMLKRMMALLEIQECEEVVLLRMFFKLPIISRDDGDGLGASVQRARGDQCRRISLCLMACYAAALPGERL